MGNDFFSANNVTAPANDSAFAMPSNAAQPTDSFEGRLDIALGSANFQTVRDDYGFATRLDSPARRLPAFSIEFVQDGASLIPVKEGLVYSGDAIWNYIVGPGRVWKQSDDSGYMRASFPFALVERNNGWLDCMHNGEMSFLFSNTLSPNISNVRYQVTQETCGKFKFDMWGVLPAKYTPYAISNSSSLKQDHAAEVANRILTKPFSSLATDFPNSGVNLAAFIQDFQSAKDLTTYGLVIDGVNYVSDCQTRYGTYAFCGDMRFPSFSTSKSAFTAVAMMRLGQLYGTGVYRQLIRDYVPEYMSGGDWTNVTFDNTADMATGNYISSGYMADNECPEEFSFYTAEAYRDKIYDSFRLFPHRAQPGTSWVYQTHANFIVAQAMNAYLQQKQGAGADIFNLVRDDVYIPLHLSKGGLTTLRTDNSEAGKPMGGFGLFYIQDDIAKLATWLNAGNGMISDKPVLDPVRLRESLYRTPGVWGLPARDINSTPTAPDTVWYNNGFWGKKMTRDVFPQYSCDFWVSYMGGSGKILLMPNGAVFYVISDNGETTFTSAINETNKLVPFCQ